MVRADIKYSRRIHPHDFDIYSMSIDGSNVKHLTHLKHYGMADLSVSQNGNKLFFTSFGELDGPDSPEESFESTQRLYAMSLEKTNEITQVKVKGQFEEPNIFDAQISPNGKKIVFKAIADKNEEGTYEYELFVMGRETNEATQLTNLHASVSNPAFFHSKNKMLFLEQTNWPADPEPL